VTDETCASCGASVPPGAWYCLACGSAHAAPRPPAPAGARRAAMLAALLAVAVLGAVGGAWIERRQHDAAPAPVTVPTVITQTVTQPAPPPPAATTVAGAAEPAERGGPALRPPS